MTDQETLEQICRTLLRAIGEDTTRPGLKDTPKRWAKWWMEFMSYNDDNLSTTFESVKTDQMVALTGIRVWSLCEHHLLPFWCDISIAYLSTYKIIGISKLARIAQHHAHGLNVQEKLVSRIADTVEQNTGSKHVAVIAKGQHLCMSMRGIKSEAMMVSNEMRGRFLEREALRMELLAMVN